MSDVLETIKSRRSIRKYKSDMVPQDKLEKIIEAGTYAATGMGKQSPIIVAVTNKELRDKLSAMNAKIMGTNTDPFYGAPVVLIVLADKSRPTYLYDGSLVMGNLMLEAEAQGIGSCWIHRAKEEFESEEGKEILKSLGIEGDYEGIGHCVLGFADGTGSESSTAKRFLCLLCKIKENSFYRRGQWGNLPLTLFCPLKTETESEYNGDNKNNDCQRWRKYQ